MPQGIQVFNPDGSILLDTSNRTFRVLTIQLLSTASDGNFTSAEMAKGVPLVGVASAQVGVLDTTQRRTPALSVSGNTVSWSWSGIPLAERATDSMISIAVF